MAIMLRSRFAQLNSKLDLILKGLAHITMTEKDFESKIAALTTAVNNETAAVDAETKEVTAAISTLTFLQTQIANMGNQGGATPEQLTELGKALDGLNDRLTASTGNLGTSVTGLTTAVNAVPTATTTTATPIPPIPSTPNTPTP